MLRGRSLAKAVTEVEPAAVGPVLGLPGLDGDGLAGDFESSAEVRKQSTKGYISPIPLKDAIAPLQLNFAFHFSLVLSL